MRFVVFLFTTCLLLFVNASAQDSSRSRLSLTFTTPVLSISYGVEGGIEYQVSKHWSVFSELVVPVLKFRNTFDKIRSARTNTELRWYYGKVYGSYFSLQYGHNFRTFYNYHEGSYHQDLKTDTLYSYSSARIKSPVTTLALLFGGKIFTEGRFFIDMSIGMGARFISTSYDAQNVVRSVNVNMRKEWILFTPDQAYNYNCNLTRFQGSIAIRAGINL